MAKICILIALLPQLLYTLVQGQESPCPQYFKYTTKPGTDETIGQIEIQSPPKTDELHLKVILKVAAKLPTKYFGRLELAQSNEESAQAVLQGRHLSYFLYFPLRHPIPTLFKIWLNGVQYCSGPDFTTGRTITTITLEHTLYLPNILSQSFQPNPSFQDSKPTSRPTRRVWSTSKKPSTTVTPSQGISNNIPLKIPNQPLQFKISLNPIPTQSIPQYNNIFPSPTTAKLPQDNNNNDNENYENECGISGHSRTNLLIANGQKTLPGQWPWLVAIFVVKNNYEYQCAGSLLTTRHVLTAAHCLKLDSTSNDTILPNVLEVALGRFKLLEFREHGTVNREVASYKIHPDYAHTTNGDSDLAILILRTRVEFSPFIRPICLWSQSTNLQDILNKVGYVIGWGRDEYGHRFTEEPLMAMMPIVSMENCHWSHPIFVSLTSNRTFCAGMQDGSGPCNGDSGSGLVLFDTITGRYQLRGVVSRSLFGDEPLCDLKKFIVFVDVAKYLPWIVQQISST